MKISKFFLTVSAVAGICLWCGIYPAAAQDEAISADLFTEGKTWSRIMQVLPHFPPITEPVNVTVTYTVVKGYKPQSPPPDEIVIEIVNPSRRVVPDNIMRIGLSPENGNFRGYYDRNYGGDPTTWYKATEALDRERYKNRLYILEESVAQFSYPFLPLPIPWKDSAFLLDNDYTGPPVKVTTKIENITLKVVCTISTYGYMLPDKKVKDDEIILIGKIHMVFKKGEPWAASVWTESEDLNAFSAHLKMRSPGDK